MWLAERAARAGEPAGLQAETGTVTIGGSSAAVLLSGECRDVRPLAPGGVLWLPEAGEPALVLETGAGERFLLGIAAEADGLAAGELELRRGDAAIRLRRDGTILLRGAVQIEGSLALNGTELEA